MKKELSEIVKEINELDYKKVCELAFPLYRYWKDGKYTQEDFTEEYWKNEAEELKQDAIQFISKKYEKLSKYTQDEETEFYYELAYYRAFRMLGIVLDKAREDELHQIACNKIKWVAEAFNSEE